MLQRADNAGRPKPERARSTASGRRIDHPPLIIRRVDAIPVVLPLKAPMKMASVTIAEAASPQPTVPSAGAKRPRRRP